MVEDSKKDKQVDSMEPLTYPFSRATSMGVLPRASAADVSAPMSTSTATASASPAAAAALLALLALAAAGGVAADGSDHRYKAGEPVPLYANKVGPFHNPR